MRTLRLALAQINPTVGDLEGNVRKITDYIEQARSLKADLVAFPELAIPGYPPEDLLMKPSFIRDNISALKKVVEAARDIAVVTGFVDSNSDIFNAAAVAYDGKLAGVYHKIFLPTYGVFDEDRYFQRGNRCPVFTINGVKVAVNICEDIWYAVGPLVVQRLAGAEVVVNINGSPYHAGKGVFREQMIGTRASDNGLYVAYVNTVGGQDELVFDGASLISDPKGRLVARGKQFQEDLIVADLDVDDVMHARLRDPRLRKEGDLRLDDIGVPEVIHVSDYQPRERSPLPPHVFPPLDPIGEIYHALVLGTRDYVRKTGFKKALIGLSGGIDSSMVACVAVDALGKENVIGIAMPSRYSSEGSLIDAKLLAENLGIELRIIPIEPAHRAYEEMLEPHFRGTQPGVAEENIQARIRGNILMALSNKFGWIVLTTGDKSEMATGFATLYGDMAGGFAVIKDVLKTMVYKLARWRNENGHPKNVVPEAVLRKAPSPELKPNQKAQDTLPPYEILDPILKAYVEEERSYQDLVDMGFDPETVKRVITMVDKNEYKRRQAPPGVKITPLAFGRDRRLPIVNRYRQF